MTPTRIDIALFNYQDGGWRPPLGSDRRPLGYDFRGLQYAFGNVRHVPDLVLMCEGKWYHRNGREALHAVAETFTDEWARPYVGLLGWMSRGPLPPMIFYNPDVLILRSWPDPNDPDVFDDHRNVARFAVRSSGGIGEQRTEFLAFVCHWDSRSGDRRLQEATLLDRYGSAERRPVIGGGDFNSMPSGPHMPPWGWQQADFRARAHRGIQLDDHAWAPDTRAVDYLIGTWRDGRRVGGCGFSSVADLAWQADPSMTLRPTTNIPVAEGGGGLIDDLLVNPEMEAFVLRDSYEVHVPDAGSAFSDHRLVTAAIEL